MRKIAKQFDRAVLESTKLSRATIMEKKKDALLRQQQIQGNIQDEYFKKIKIERFKLVKELMSWKENTNGYPSIYENIRETCKNYNTV